MTLALPGVVPVVDREAVVSWRNLALVVLSQVRLAG